MRATSDFFNQLRQEITSTIIDQVEQLVKADDNSNDSQRGEMVEKLVVELRSRISELEAHICKLNVEKEDLSLDLHEERYLRKKMEQDSGAPSASEISELQSTIQSLTEEKYELQQELKKEREAKSKNNSEQSVSVTSAVEFAENYIEQNRSCLLTVRDFILYIFNPKEMPDELYDRIRNLGAGPRETVNMGDNNGIVAGGSFSAKISLTDKQTMMVADRLAGQNLLGEKKDGNNN